MSFFSKLKQKLKDVFDGDDEGGSHPRHRRRSASFDVTFAEDTLGVSIGAEEGTGAPVVTHVAEGSAAHIGGVERNHYVLAVEGSPVSSCEDFASVIHAIGRPVTVTFGRKRRSSRADLLAEELEAKAAAQRKKQANALTEEEKAARRDAALKAAEERNRAWEKRLGSSKRTEAQQKQSAAPTTTAPPKEQAAAASNPDTQRVVEAAKRAEQKAVEELGYNPFTPLMNTTSEARYAQTQVQAGPVTAPSNSDAGSQSQSNSVVSSPRLETQSSDSIDTANLTLPYVDGELNEAAVAQIEEAVQLLATQDLPALHQAVQTILKILGNIALHPEQPKYRTVKMQNKVFQKRVAEVEGGLQTMIAAAFHMHIENDEASLVYPNPEMSMDESSARLRYTYNRVRMCL